MITAMEAKDNAMLFNISVNDLEGVIEGLNKDIKERSICGLKSLIFYPNKIGLRKTIVIMDYYQLYGYEVRFKEDEEIHICW